MYGLDKPIEELLVSARSRGTSVVTSFQAPAWVPKAATRQATFCVLWPTRDRNMIKAVAESMGRTWQDVVAAVDELPPFHTLTIPKRVHAPMVITVAPKL
jgi:predicted NUDIX family NTP pyrophosphohydrolase